MKQITIFLITLVSFYGQDVLAQKPWCEIRGTVFITDSPRLANWSVYEEKEESFADVLVFKETNRLFADKSGQWHFVNNPGLADYIIYMVPSRAQADFSIHYTSVASFAGCR